MRAPLLLHTPGEPGGIGHECLLRIAQQASPGCRVALTDAALLQASAQRLGLPITLQPVPATPAATPAGVLYVEDLPTEVPTIPGQCRPEHAAMQLAALRRAVHWLGEAPGALVTGPVQKSALAQAEPGFSGHTEYLAREAGVARVVMLLAAPTLRVALATTHLPLRAVPDALERADLLCTLRILDQDLRTRFGLAEPRIAVCGLNPHAGEDGLLGDEEQRIIAPAIADARRAGVLAEGPWPADTIFTPRRLEGYAAVLAMYHDQGLPTLKYAGFGQAVNVTLGLPFVRTSVDHGTGLDIAGRGVADPGSLQAAEALALSLCAGMDTGAGAGAGAASDPGTT